jgi:peptide/nickel transport system permease protein
MGRFVTRRLALGLITLLILSVLVFFGAQVLPGDVARRILGPFADQSSVDALNEELGTDQPLITQYWDWLTSALQGDFGESTATQRPVSEIIRTGFENSVKLAVLAFILVVPLGIFGGVYAAMHEGTWKDRVLSVGGLSATAIPEFVWAVLLILVFALGLGWFPTTAQAPGGAGPLTELKYLLLPALCLVFVLFGYIARMARAGTIEALDADYTRTATLKGLPRRTVVRKHVLRNSLLPTIAVVATQTGYLIGGLVAIEVIFNYNGIGQALFRAAQQKDFPVLQGTVLIIGAIYFIATLIADLLYSVLNPRVRLGAAE